ncbi:hypothetical protein [Sphingomonas trueperi]|uniref:Uncharacterized protein n=1 Tax=Sphingomonas trueperi TaxID=53317 RepID=A0A7X5Y2H4_9SPHN|nr:hypothetical protein [Sphingomonas trueperi]NJB99892.1 hypothetical protein [Sphingomonas trueperi]
MITAIYRPRTRDIRVMRDDGSHFDLSPAEAMRLSKALLEAIDVPTLVASLTAEAEPMTSGNYKLEITHPVVRDTQP